MLPTAVPALQKPPFANVLPALTDDTAHREEPTVTALCTVCLPVHREFLDHVRAAASAMTRGRKRGKVEVALRAEGKDLEWLPRSYNCQSEHSGIPVYTSAHRKCPGEHAS